MPFDQAGFDVGQVVRVLTPEEQRDLDVLRKTLASLRERGSWVQGAIADGDARCIVEWLGVHTRQDETQLRLVARRLAGSLEDDFTGTFGGHTTTALVNYNDMRSRRKHHMIELVERAIAKLEHV